MNRRELLLGVAALAMPMLPALPMIRKYGPVDWSPEFLAKVYRPLVSDDNVFRYLSDGD